jgi:hypothetical protein
MIVKYCHEEHNCLKGSKLLIGNTYKYRSIENDELRDDGEGTFDFSIEILEGATLPTQWANLIFQGIIAFGNAPPIRFPGRFDAHIESVEIDAVRENDIVFKHAKANIKFSDLNKFVFCTSSVELDPMAERPFQQYNDFWVVGQSQDQLDNFAGRIASALLHQMKFQNLKMQLTDKRVADFKNLVINVEHRKVEYVERNLVINKELIGNFDAIIRTYLSSSFVKTKNFSREREYRFVFSPIINNQIIEVSNTDVLLDLNLLTAYF